MATTTHTVKKGETLSGIAAQHGVTYQFLAKINNIPDPNKIYVGQVIILAEVSAPSSGGSGGSGGSSSSTNSNMAVIKHFGLQSNTDRTVLVSWSWSKSNTKEYEIYWAYDTGDGIWFTGSESVIENKGAYVCHSSYTAPNNATKVRFQVRPISTTHKVNDKDTSYWTAQWSTAKDYYFSSNPPTTPAAPTVTMDELKLTAELQNLDVNAKEIEFQIVKDDSSVFKTGTATIKTNSASYSCTATIGSEYKVRCRSKRDSLYSDWSEYSTPVRTPSGAPSGITTCRADSKTSVYLAWNKANGADTYDIQYATAENLFNSNDVHTINGITSLNYIVTGLESGETYYFRIRGVNAQGESGWTSLGQTVLGQPPSAPTTWSSTTTAMLGETVYLYWMHNTQDGSKEKNAKLEYSIDGNVKTIEILNNDFINEDAQTNSHWTIRLSQGGTYREGAVLEWRVRTCGVTDEYGPWSMKRRVDIYAPPTLSTRVVDVSGENLDIVKSFPFYIRGDAGPNTQTPIGYYVSIYSNDTYETVDDIGNIKMVSSGDEVYSKFYDTTDDLVLELTASSIDLQNNASYTVHSTVTMDSGLTAESTDTFTVYWEDMVCTPNAEISVDPETLSAHIRPYCEVYGYTYYLVKYNSSTGKYVRTNTTIAETTGISVDGVLTTDGEIVYRNDNGTYFSVLESDTGVLVEGITLSVYRREFDGSFIEIGSGLSNTRNTFVTDPHPSLDYARYRIVATSDDTGAVNYADIPGYVVGEKAVVIQWDETWSEFDARGEDIYEKPVWSGSMVKLPYNIDVSDSNTSDVSLVKYIGRTRPVSYYGTQIESTSTWNVDIAKEDKNTLYALRRLAMWMGDVYVREPSGSGYWANISISFSQTHCETVIPVTINITRVEGGI